MTAATCSSTPVRPRWPTARTCVGRAEHEVRELHGVHAEVERGPAAERRVEEPVGGIERRGEPEVGLDEADLADAPGRRAPGRARGRRAGSGSRAPP